LKKPHGSSEVLEPSRHIQQLSNSTKYWRFYDSTDNIGGAEYYNVDWYCQPVGLSIDRGFHFLSGRSTKRRVNDREENEVIKDRSSIIVV